MDNSKARLPVSYTINNFVDTADSRFLAITIDVLHTGLNCNGSIFRREVVDACAESIVNTPVLGYIALNPSGELDFQGHEYETVHTADGKDYVYAGSAYGVIPESCNYRWIQKISSDGVCREYFQVDALLWTKFQDAVSVFERDGGKPQSMELQLSSIAGEEQEDGKFVFTGFKFDGCCLLSSTDERIQPAMIDSIAVAKFSVASIAEQIRRKLNQYAVSVGKISRESEDDLMEKETGSDFALTVNEHLHEIQAVLAQTTYQDEWGFEAPQYLFVDVQGDEVIVMDRNDHYRLYGVKYKITDDAVSIDFASAVRKKTVYQDFVSPDDTQTENAVERAITGIAGYMNAQITKLQNDKAQTEAEYMAIRNEIDELKPKYDAYVAAERERVQTSLEAAKDAEFAKFDPYLGNNERYIGLKQERDRYTVEEIQSQCAILYTEMNLNASFSRRKEGKMPMVAEVFEWPVAGSVSDRYGILPTKQGK